MKDSKYITGLRITGFLLFLNCIVSSAIAIDFTDIFYTEILETLKFRTVNDPNYCMMIISDDAVVAEENYNEMVSRWNDPNLTSSEYQNAATWMLVHCELNKRMRLTLGTVIQMLGVPDDIRFYGSRFNGREGIDPDVENFSAVYSRKKVSIDFSVMGFVSIVRDVDSVMNNGRLYWPRQYCYSEIRPVCSCSLEEDDALRDGDISNLVLSLEDSCKRWKRAAQKKWVEAGNSPDSLQLSTEIMLLDIIRKDTAGAFCEIKYNKATLYKTLWCHFDGGKWTLLKDDKLTALASLLSCSSIEK